MLARFTGGGVFRRALCPRVALHSALRRSTAASPDSIPEGPRRTSLSRTLCADLPTVSRGPGHDLVSAGWAVLHRTFHSRHGRETMLNCYENVILWARFLR